MAHLSKLKSVYNDIGYSQEETAKMELMIYQVEQAALLQTISLYDFGISGRTQNNNKH